jgi:hypothetical protein
MAVFDSRPVSVWARRVTKSDQGLAYSVFKVEERKVSVLASMVFDAFRGREDGLLADVFNGTLDIDGGAIDVGHDAFLLENANYSFCFGSCGIPGGPVELTGNLLGLRPNSRPRALVDKEQPALPLTAALSEAENAVAALSLDTIGTPSPPGVLPIKQKSALPLSFAAAVAASNPAPVVDLPVKSPLDASKKGGPLPPAVDREITEVPPVQLEQAHPPVWTAVHAAAGRPCPANAMLNNCPTGSACPYSHEQCADFRLGKCSRVVCFYHHDKTAAQKTAARAAALKLPEGGASSARGSGGASTSQTTLDSSSLSTTAGVLCPDNAMSSKCPRGKACPWVHRICFDHATGHCWRSPCQYHHADVPGTVDKFCPDNAMFKTCARGPSCRYSHRLCFDYSTGSCTRSNCVFHHGDAPKGAAAGASPSKTGKHSGQKLR